MERLLLLEHGCLLKWSRGPQAYFSRFANIMYKATAYALERSSLCVSWRSKKYRST